MRVEVTVLRERGRYIVRDKLQQVPATVGALSMKDVHDSLLSRDVRQASLLPATSRDLADLLPPLWDVQLLLVKGQEMRLAGYERIEGVDYAQTWVVRVPVGR